MSIFFDRARVVGRFNYVAKMKVNVFLQEHRQITLLHQFLLTLYS